MRVDGSQIQNAIYISGDSRWPVGAGAWEELAQEVLDPGPFGYIAGGAGNENTMRANLDAFERRRLKPRMLSGNAERDASVEVLGTPSPVPFFLAPLGVLSIAHRTGRSRLRARPHRCASRSCCRAPRLIRSRRSRRRWETHRDGSSSTG